MSKSYLAVYASVVFVQAVKLLSCQLITVVQTACLIIYLSPKENKLTSFTTHLLHVGKTKHLSNKNRQADKSGMQAGSQNDPDRDEARLSGTKLALAQGAGRKRDYVHCKQDMLCSS